LSEINSASDKMHL